MRKMTIQEVPSKKGKEEKTGSRFLDFFRRHRKVASKNSLVRVYAIFKITDENRTNPIAFVSTPEQALEAIDLYDYYTHFSHFSSWCKIHNYTIDDTRAWDRYAETVLAYEAEEDDSYGYTMVEYFYSQDNLASIIRMTALCTPLGASYENDAEQENYDMAMGHEDPSDLDRSISEAAAALKEAILKRKERKQEEDE